MILVTGTSGFIGSALLDKLISRFGRDYIIAMTSIPTEKCHYLFHNDYNFDNDYIVKSGYEEIKIIIHAGAYTPKNANQANDVLKCTSNILNTNTILKTNFPNLEKIIFLSTLDVYDICDVLTEESPVGPVSLYGESKLYCEKMISAFAYQNEVLGQILRIGHVYGPGEERYQKVIPMMIRKLLNNESIQIFGSGDDIRSFIYINDVTEAILSSLDLEFYHGPINIVSENKISIKDLALSLIKNAESNSTIEFHQSENLKRRDLVFDNSKMKKYLLQNEVDLDFGLKTEFNYMKNLM